MSVCICRKIIDAREKGDTTKAELFFRYLKRKIARHEYITYPNQLGPLIQKINQKLEFADEWHTAHNFLYQKTSRTDIESRYSFYRDLVKNDCRILGPKQKTIKTVVFVGGGPLPLTAIYLHLLFGYKVTVIEADTQSYDISTQLIDQWGLTDHISIVQIRGSHFTGYKDHDCVFLSSFLNYYPEEKMAIEKHLADIKHETIVARTVSGAGNLLYKPFVPQYLSIVKHRLAPMGVVNEALLLTSKKVL